MSELEAYRMLAKIKSLGGGAREGGRGVMWGGNKILMLVNSTR